VQQRLELGGSRVTSNPTRGRTCVIETTPQRRLQGPTGVETSRLAFRVADLVAATGISRRTIERERAAGRFPAPDRFVGRSPLWLRETVLNYLHGA
jgi:predicted DNA-binding transcriptional regulator AlpA